MNIFITGANGFIAAHLVTALHQTGHSVICCVRSLETTQRRFPFAKVIPCDFNHDTSAELWENRLRDNHVDAVINCVGVLQGGKKQSIDAIHRDTPIALFEGCKRAGVKRIIQLSALGAGEVDTAYSKTKQAADDYLLAMTGLSTLVLRPSIVFGTGSRGGTSFFRAFSALPWVIPIIGKGNQLMAPVFLADFCRAVIHYIEHPEISGTIINIVGSEQVSQKSMFIKFRQWLGLPKAICLGFPLWLVKPLAKLGDFFVNSPLNTTSIKMTVNGNVADPKPFQASIDFTPQSFSDVLNHHPCSVQDRWHARLYFLKPMLHLSLIILWLVSGLVPLINPEQSNAFLMQMGIADTYTDLCRYLLSSLDILIGLGILANWRRRFMGQVQFWLVLTYTLSSAVFIPAEWLNPIGPLVKNIPILVAILIWASLEDERQ